MTRDAALFDLDGTLCDTTSIEHLIAGEEKDFPAFHAASAGCPPRADVLAGLNAAREAGRAIVLWTSREFVWRDLTLDWLDQHQIVHDGLYMRLSADFRPAATVKTELLRDIAADGFRVVEAWEDGADIVDLLREAGVPVVRAVGAAG